MDELDFKFLLRDWIFVQTPQEVLDSIIFVDNVQIKPDTLEDLLPYYEYEIISASYNNKVTIINLAKDW